MEIRGKKILITGASRGIGRALAEEIAKRNGSLHLVARSFPKNAKESLLALGAPSVTLWPLDLTQAQAREELVNRLRAVGVQIDILINNAGQLSGGLLEEQTSEEIDSMFSVNLNALVHLTRLFLPGMLLRDNGKIVNNASVSGKMFFPCASTYAASKAAVVAFTESLKQELRGTGVSTLLLLTPGVKTQMYEDIEKLYGEYLDLSFLSSIPAEKWADQVANAIETGEETLWPQGLTRFGVFIAHHFPALFEWLVRKKFSRDQRIIGGPHSV